MKSLPNILTGHPDIMYVVNRLKAVMAFHSSRYMNRVSTEINLKFQTQFQKKVAFFQPFWAEKAHCFQPYHDAIENAVRLLSQSIE